MIPFVGGVVEELLTVPDLEEAFAALASRPHCVFFDSARRDAHLGRYSILTADPFDWLQLSVDEIQTVRSANSPSPFDLVAAKLSPFATETVAGLPPFQGGAAGLFGYDLLHAIERVPRARIDEFDVPAVAIGLYDVVLAIDHQQNRAWIISQGWPECDSQRRTARAAERLAAFKSWLVKPLPAKSAEISAQRGVDEQESSHRIPAGRLARQHATLAGTLLTSNFSRDEYLRTIERAIEFIRAGDIFQVNLAQRLLHPGIGSAVELYLRLRQRNPATFAGYFDMGDFQIVSASPERCFSVVDGHVEARPIKGTRRRSPWPESNLFAGDELLQSEKDRAENVMIVDLLRNDLSRVCLPDSVRVTDLCKLETYEFVQHLVSVIRAELRPRKGALDLLAAAFPGGSITGAPKVRAMQIIAELEPTARGAYCGCLGYIGFDGTMDTSILIRTITAGRGWWQLPVGGGIVADSDPQREYEETWHKAEGMLRALQ